MEGGARQPDGSEWPPVAEEERILYELLFFSQGPVDGYLLGEDVRDLFLKSGLSLRVLSQIWNLADVSNDNVLNVHEFVLVMHLIRGLLKGLKAPPTLPRKLTPPKSQPLTLQPPTPQEREAYTKVFQALDVDRKGFLDGDCCRQVFQASGLTSEVLTHVWNLSDVTRDGRLDVDEFCVACHLLRFLKAGNSISGPVDVFTLLPDRIASQSLQARKRRVQQYEQHKQKLMSLKEKRRLQVVQENKRLQLQQEKLDLLRQVYKIQKKTGKTTIPQDEFSANVSREKEEIEKLEEIVYRLKKEHEKIRQETVKIILAEQKLNNDIVTIKKDTNELNKRLGTCHTHATKNPDPFHQLYEQRKEKRQGSTIKDLDKIEVSLPFDFNPFDPGLSAQSLSQGAQLFANTGNNHSSRGNNFHAVIEGLGGFGEGFEARLATSSASDSCDMEQESVFKEVPVSMDGEPWLGLQWGSEDDPGAGVFGLSGAETEELQEKLLNLRAELRKLNEPGSRLVFKNPDDYLARKRAREEEEKADRSSRFQRRSLTERRSYGLSDSPRGHRADNHSPQLRDRGTRDRHSYTERNEEVSQAVREYRQKRQSLQSLDSSLSASANSSASSSPREQRQQTPERPSRSKRTSSSGSSSGPQASPREEVPVPASFEVSTEPRAEQSPQNESPVTSSASSPGRPSRPLQPAQEEATETSAPLVVAVTSPSTAVSSQPDSPRAAAVVNTDKQNHQKSSAAKQNGGAVKPAEGQKAESGRQTNVQSAQRSTSPPSAPGVSSAKPSSKKSRAPPPPPAASSGTSAKAPAASSSPRGPTSRPDVKKSAAEHATATAAGQEAPASRSSAAAGPRLVQPQAEESKAVSVQSNPPPAQSTSPERPARPKRRKEAGSGSGSGSNPSSPRDAPAQPPPLAVPAAGKALDGDTSLLTDVLSALPDNFRLSENPALAEEAPPAPCTVTVTGKSASVASGRKEKPAVKPAAGSAKDGVPPLQLNSSSQPVASSEPVKQKRRKAKAPEPPSSSADTSPRNPPASTSTPSSGGSPRDAPPSTPAEGLPNTHTAAKAAEAKAEKSVPTKTKAPPPPDPARSNPVPTAEPRDAEPREAQLRLSTDTETTVPPKVPTLTIPDQSPEPVERGTEKEREKDRDSDRGRASETSSICDSDADSLPPPLPSSAPPPLPCSPPPSQLPAQDLLVEEVIEVRQVSPVRGPPPALNSGKMEDGVMQQFDSLLPDTLLQDSEEESQKKSMANLRAEFFGLDSQSNGNKANTDLLDMNFGDLEGSKVKDRHEEVTSGDSDLSSDERGFEGTFSPGDSGVVMSSLPTSPDDSDSRIQLLSYTAHSAPSSATASDTSSADVKTSSPSSSSQGPPNLTMKEPGSPTSSGDTLSPTSAQSVSAQDMAALSPRSREIFEKARHFAEMVQKPTFVAKRENVDEAEEEFSQETLQDFEMERRAVISLSTVRKKDAREVLSPPPRDVTVTFSNVVEQVPAAQQSVGPQAEREPSPERAASPEARWNDKVGRVNMYSENVVQEPQSTDVVNRESIANLATTRRQWENIFTSEPEESNPKPKKNPPKWQVRLPYAEKTHTSPATVTSNASTEPESPSPSHTSNMAEADTESAIEREIRLAVEREAMLKREQEERLRQVPQQSQRGFQVSSMESSTESELQPSFHELTEADRGSEFFINERVVQQEDAEQEESLQRGFSHQKFNSVSKGDNATESIIEREIRLQREREAELAKQRGGHSAPRPAVADTPPQPQRQRAPSPEPVEEEEVQDIPYEEAISRYNHEGESRIAQELRELREREEEVRQLREKMNKAIVGGDSGDLAPKKPAAASTPSPAAKQPHKPPSAPQTPGGDRSAPTTPRTDKVLTPTVTHSLSRNVHASPLLDTNTPVAEAPSPKQETPIEREIRLARERENELRRAKGLPELQPEPKKQESFDEPDSGEFVGTPRYYSPQPDTSMRRFATNRLQQEMLVQHNREMMLRQEGKIISTSEEHIQPLRYSEVVGQDKADVTVKRNFKTPGRRSSGTSQDELNNGDSSLAPSSRPKGAPQTLRDGAGKKGQRPGSVSFSYREFAQTAESKIERELREMREREEELRKQRTGGAES